MKNIIKFLSVIALFAAVLSCKKEPKADKSVAGEWHLIEMTDMSSLPQVYITLAEDKTFDLYQKLGEGRYRRHTGTYTYSNRILDGKYSDNSPWGSSYEVSFDGEILVLTAQNGTSEVTRYEKKALSATDKADAELVTKSVEDGPRFF